jgi:transcription initiation factor TFIIB
MLSHFGQHVGELRLFYSRLLQPGLRLSRHEALRLESRLSVFLQVMAGCPACGGPLITDRERGEVVCAQCGLVVSESAVDTGPERRVFDEREKRRVRTAPLKLVVKTDMAVKPEHGVQWRRLARFHRETMHGFERRLAKIGGEIRRVKECVGLPQSVAEEAESLVKRFFEVVAGFPPEVVAVAVLWTPLRRPARPGRWRTSSNAVGLRSGG